MAMDASIRQQEGTPDFGNWSAPYPRVARLMLGMGDAFVTGREPLAVSTLPFCETVFLQAYVHNMFSSDSQQTERNNMQNPAIIISIAMAASSPAYAQSFEPATDVSATAASENAGVRVEQGQSFTLLVHGNWSAPIQIAGPPEVQDPTRVRPIPKQDAGKSKAPRSSLLRRQSYLPWVAAAELRHALPTGLLDAIIWVESKYNPLAMSPKGAGGLGQLMPPTASSVGVRNRFDPYDNIEGAARYLRQMLDKFGLVHLAVAAYNAGPGAVARSKGIPANRETPSYVSQVLARWAMSGS
jgi:Transglycosylase SLT domain